MNFSVSGLNKHRKKYNIFVGILILVLAVNTGYTVTHKDKYRSRVTPDKMKDTMDMNKNADSSGDASIAYNEVIFKDPNLEHIIRFDLNKPDEKIRVKDVWGITYLNLNHCNLVNLEGMQFFRSLNKLDLSFNNLSDVSPLTKLPALHELYIYSNQIGAKGLAQISSIKTLTTLDVSNNKVSDLTTIEEMKHLTDLDLNNNQIVDVTPLNRLTGLKVLDISRNNIADFSPIKKRHYKLFLDWGNKSK